MNNKRADEEEMQAVYDQLMKESEIFVYDIFGLETKNGEEFKESSLTIALRDMTLDRLLNKYISLYQYINQFYDYNGIVEMFEYMDKDNDAKREILKAQKTSTFIITGYRYVGHKLNGRTPINTSNNPNIELRRWIKETSCEVKDIEHWMIPIYSDTSYERICLRCHHRDNNAVF